MKNAPVNDLDRKVVDEIGRILLRDLVTDAPAAPIEECAQLIANARTELERQANFALLTEARNWIRDEFGMGSGRRDALVAKLTARLEAISDPGNVVTVNVVAFRRKGDTGPIRDFDWFRDPLEAAEHFATTRWDKDTEVLCFKFDIHTFGETEDEITDEIDSEIYDRLENPAALTASNQST